MSRDIEMGLGGCFRVMFLTKWYSVKKSIEQPRYDFVENQNYWNTRMLTEETKGKMFVTCGIHFHRGVSTLRW